MATLLEQTKEYLTSYLAAFAEESRTQDIRYFSYGREIPAYMLRNWDCNVEEVDLHELNLKQIMSQLPQASLQDFRDAVISMENPMVLDVASIAYGNLFGIFIARGNEDAEVHVYNPGNSHEAEYRNKVPAVLLDDDRPEMFAKLKRVPKVFDRFDENSINELYRVNGLNNIEFHKTAMYQTRLEQLAEEHSERQIVIFSHRTPTWPQELSHQIAAVAADHENVDMILGPYFNDEIRAYEDDPTIGLINKYPVGRDQCIDREFNNRPYMEVPEARLFLATQLYYSLKIAEAANAKVYTKKDLTCPSCNPSHYVSTIEL